MDVAAWAMVAVAAEPYLVSALGTYTPLLLEQLARSNGVSAIDHLTPCVPQEGTPVAPGPPPENMACVLPVMGGRLYIDTASYALYTFSLAVLLQTICVMTMSGVADNSDKKKLMLVGFGVVGGGATSLFIFVGVHNYYLASVLAIVGNCCLGVINVLINSYMILLINNRELKDEEERLLGDRGAVEYSGETSIANGAETSARTDVLGDGSVSEEALGKVGAKISGIGTSSGYAAALAVQLSSLLGLVVLKAKGGEMIWSTKIIISCVGVWWLGWQVPIARYLRNFNAVEEGQPHMHYGAMIRKGYHDIYHAVVSVGELKHVYFFLLGWFVLADSITTINSTAMLFAKTTLNMPMVSIGIMGVLVMLSAICGSIVIPRYIIATHKWDLQHVLLGIMLWCLVVPVYGIFFLRRPWEVYVLGVWYGIGLGGLSTVSRSIYSLIIPRGKESVFFSIFSLTDKGSSIAGPLLVGMVIDVLHDLRMAFWILAILLILSILIIGFKFDLHDGRLHALAFV